MPRTPWTEDDVLALPPGEDNRFERKGSRLLDLTIPTVDQNDVFNEPAKQLSAFANSGGGSIVYGVTNSGTVDNGGIARSVKGTQSSETRICGPSTPRHRMGPAGAQQRRQVRV